MIIAAFISLIALHHKHSCEKRSYLITDMASQIKGLREELICQACKIATNAHKSSSDKPYISETSVSVSRSSEVIFGFTGGWDIRDWFTHKPFGEVKINQNIFPSLKTIGSNEAATVNQAFLQRFEALLANSSLKHEVEKAAIENKQIVFTGHSLGAATAILATLWFLESQNQRQINQTPPLCITFGSPLVGDKILTHSVKREHWSQYFTHFVMRYDIVPRISLAPLSFIERELQYMLDSFNPKSPLFKSESVQRTAESSMFILTVMRNTSLVASRAACQFMGCTNLLLENVTNFIELSPYRPFGTYVFCTRNKKFVVENPDAILQILYYCLQLGSESEWDEVAQKSLQEHIMYENELLNSLVMSSVAYLQNLEDLPLCTENSGQGENFALCGALNNLGLSTRARLCLRAAGELEKQKARNQLKINSNKNKIKDVLNKIERYQASCEDRKVGYYDAFKMQKHTEDFNSNIRRLELAGIWDEIIEMLKRNELPDEFEGEKEWIEIGTKYRRLVEPLDIANYYRHLKNEDTGSYIGKGRPSRYKYTQKWHEHAEKVVAEPVPKSCFWAEVEELCIITRNTEFFDHVNERVIHLERKVSLWFRNGLLSKDVFLNESTFVQWWKKLHVQHRSSSCIRDLFLE